MPRIYLEAYGCSANVADAEIAMGLLKESGYELVSSPESADLNVIVTCAVKKPTADRMLYRMKRLSSTGKPLVVAGCMASGETGRVKRAVPTASLLHPRAIDKVTLVAEKALSGERVELLNDGDVVKSGLPRVRKNKVVSIVPVSEGCRWSKCGFCIVPRTRGSFGSYPLKRIVEEVRESVKEGCKEVWLTSQDMGSYGLESGRNLLPELISLVSSVEGRFVVRVGMMNPIYLKPILNRLIEAYRSPKVFKFLHLPVQSGSEKVVKLMNRGHSVALFKEIVAEFRKAFPELSLITDIIVGYPGEEEEDFEETMKLIEEIGPESVNVSRYYPRPGTPAEKLGELPPEVVNRRSKEVSELCKEVALRKNERWIGWRGEAIVDEVGEKGEAIARNYAYRPIVLKGVKGEEFLGAFVEVEVEEARPYCLLGRIV